MAATFLLPFCASVLFAQAYSQCLNRAGPAFNAPCGARNTLNYEGLGFGVPGFGYEGPCGIAADIAAASSLNAAWGGGLQVASSSATPPTGLNVASENVYEGQLAVAGNLPFLGTVAMEGSFPSIGVGAVSYGCGDGAVGIIAENFAPAGIVAPVPAVGPAGLAPVAGLASPLNAGYLNNRVGSCGCNTVY